MRALAAMLGAAAVAVTAFCHQRPAARPCEQSARAWHEYGLALARKGQFAAAKGIFEEVRLTAPPHTRLWQTATVCLAVTCEQMQQLDEADYYFAGPAAKYGAAANTARAEFPGCWRTIRRISEAQRAGLNMTGD